MTTIALCSLLHEGPAVHSGTRRFRGEPVLNWTMRRLAMTRRIDRVVVLAWDDQLDTLADGFVTARACGPRRGGPLIDAVAAAQRWAEGWRGGLMQTCWFDNGFVAEFVRDAMTDEQADAVILVDAAAGLVDPRIIDDLAAAGAERDRGLLFTQAPPGLGGVLLKRDLVDTLTADRFLPGKLVHYLPDAPTLDPITSESCVAVPLDVSRAADRFTLDGDRQTARMERATLPLNGTLISSEASAIVRRAATVPAAADFPRDVVVELTTRRATRPVFAPSADRPDMPAGVLAALFDQITAEADVRVTFAGVGDPLLHAGVAEWVARFAAAVPVSIETDLVGVAEDVLHAVLAARPDVIAVHLPATTPATYRAGMGVDAMAEAVENVRKLVTRRARLGQGLPVVAPVFTKLAANFDEMEAWYDTWLRAVGSAVIVGPSTFGGLLADLGVADMTPPLRKPCQRLRSRLTVLSDGTVVTCEQDPTGRQALGHVSHDDLAALWRGPFADLRGRHAAQAGLPVLCSSCTEWHRP